MATLAQRRRALQAADELLNELGIDQEQPVDVFGIIDDLDLELVFNPLDTLLGAVVPIGSGGIILTTQRGASVQRYTAAHEIGHWILDIDQLAFDAEDDIFWPSVDRERLAQLFAGQLLMPPPLIYAMSRRYGISGSSVTAPAVYQAARDMGVSYEAAVRQMANLGIVDANQRDYLLSQTPGQIKAELCQGHRPQGWVDVWPVDLARSPEHLELVSGDELFVSLPENRSTGYRWQTSLEIEERAERTPAPPPEPFASEPPTPGTEIGRKSVTRSRMGGPRSRSAAAISRALARVPGNAESRRTLETAQPAPPTSPDILAALSAPAKLHRVEDRFVAGWAEIPAAAVRGVRRAIAGRTDVALPATLKEYTHDQPPPQTAARAPYRPPSGRPVGAPLDPTRIPVAATGQRLLALRSTGEGAYSLDLAYTSAVDPQASTAARYHLDVTVAAPPQVQNRRRLVQTADAASITDDTDDAPNPPGDGDAS
jgi:Zn-dependent peptidase ImmA (M78 family)/predicted secreted protein